jgi:hypothetical protein
MMILVHLVCRVCGAGVEAALPAAVGEQGEGGGGCASHHLRSEKVPAFFTSSPFYFSISHFKVGDWGQSGYFICEPTIPMCGLNLLCSSETSSNSVVQD